MKVLFLLLVLVSVVSCASKWDIGSGSAEVRRVSEPAKESGNGKAVQAAPKEVP